MMLSCPMQAGHPVITIVSANLQTTAITGSAAFADDDVETVRNNEFG
jgi:hypothetical protein